VPHRSRDALGSRYPVHVTLRVNRQLGNLRRRGTYQLIEKAFRAGSDRLGFRLAHFSVQRDHLHLICEAKDATRLSRGVKGLSVRVARKLNAHVGRRGRVFTDRYHTHILRTPREVRNALNYVLQNHIRHARRAGRTPMSEVRIAIGRDHHIEAFTMWLAGGGVKAGFSYGETDDIGYSVVENGVHVHDLHATILHLLGIDHEQLTYRFQGRDFRLTDVHGRVVHDILA